MARSIWRTYPSSSGIFQNLIEQNCPELIPEWINFLQHIECKTLIWCILFYNNYMNIERVHNYYALFQFTLLQLLKTMRRKIDIERKIWALLLRYRADYIQQIIAQKSVMYTLKCFGWSYTVFCVTVQNNHKFIIKEESCNRFRSSLMKIVDGSVKMLGFSTLSCLHLKPAEHQTMSDCPPGLSCRVKASLAPSSVTYLRNI